MPPRIGGRRSRPEAELPSGTTAQLPQELIDAIIDEFDISLTAPNNSRAFPDREALRACALVARAFVRPSQMKLFSTVILFAASYGQHPDERSRLFSKLLSSRAHIGLYVRQLVLSYRNARSNSVVHILSCLSKLQALCLYPWAGYRQEKNPPLPIHLKDAFLAAFSLSSLRRLELRAHRFANPQELESILSDSVGLKELTLNNIQFTDISASAPKVRSQAPRVVLDSLTVFAMMTDEIDAVLNTFTAVDITHLRSVCCDRHHISLLRANAHSIQELKLVLKDNLAAIPHEAILDQILPADTSLHTIELRIYLSYLVPFIIRLLGNLVNVKALKRIAITAPGGMDLFTGPRDWTDFDAGLAKVGSELEIEINLGRSRYRQPNEGEIRRLLPALTAKGFRISSMPPGSDLEYQY
ncbi:hypothetical protein C8R44DRAFT_54888 [Mycena epipterygia]|nr:hypothetical protein C8R44DRAFT_54888 [Mycena epipterygia]